jgi:hypothetical protein
MRKDVVTDITATVFIFLFAYAAGSKLVEYQKFKIQLGQSPMLAFAAASVAWVIPAIEMLIVLLLITTKYRRIGLHLSFSLMIMFSAYIIAITKFSEFIPCSCGGILSEMNWNQHLVFNMVFVVLGGTGLMLYPDNPDIYNTPFI